MEEVPFDVFLLRYPKFLTLVVNDGVLVGVSVDSISTGGSSEKIRE